MENRVTKKGCQMIKYLIEYLGKENVWQLGRK